MSIRAFALPLFALAACNTPATDATAAALADAGVQRALDGRAVGKVIVRLPRMVSIVPA